MLDSKITKGTVLAGLGEERWISADSSLWPMKIILLTKLTNHKVHGIWSVEPAIGHLHDGVGWLLGWCDISIFLININISKNINIRFFTYWRYRKFQLDNCISFLSAFWFHWMSSWKWPIDLLSNTNGAQIWQNLQVQATKLS